MKRDVVRIFITSLLTTIVLVTIYYVFSITAIAEPEGAARVLRGPAAFGYLVAQRDVGFYLSVTYQGYGLAFVVAVLSQLLKLYLDQTRRA